MRLSLFAAFTMISTLLATASDDDGAVEPAAAEVRITAQDLERLPARAELELPLTPGVLYTFSDEHGPLALDRISLRDGGRSTLLEVAAAHVAGHFGGAGEATVDGFSVGIPADDPSDQRSEPGFDGTLPFTAPIDGPGHRRASPLRGPCSCAARPAPARS